MNSSLTPSCCYEYTEELTGLFILGKTKSLSSKEKDNSLYKPAVLWLKIDIVLQPARGKMGSFGFFT